MIDHNPLAMFENYLEAFSGQPAELRERTMRSSVAEDVFFSNPGVNGRGLDNLLSHMSLFQQRFPGGRFPIDWSRQQHGQVLANGPSSSRTAPHS